MVNTLHFKISKAIQILWKEQTEIQIKRWRDGGDGVTFKCLCY